VSFTGATVTREPAGLAFLVGARNTGNTILKNVRGSVYVTSEGRSVAAATIQPGTFVSGTSIDYPLRAQREEPTPGTAYRVRAKLSYPGGVSRLDTTVVFGHAAALTQQNYGGRKLPQAPPRWPWGILLVAVLAALAGVPVLVRRRRRLPNADAALKRLDRSLERDGDRPLSLALITANPRFHGRIAAAIRPRLRGSDLLFGLEPEELLVICTATGRGAAGALRHDLAEQFAHHSRLADVPIQITLATANKPTTAGKLLKRVRTAQARHTQKVAEPRAGHAAKAPKRQHA
jgi:hypothetical protein